MWCLRWQGVGDWTEQQFRGFVVGLPDSLATVKFAVQQSFPNVKFSLKACDTGSDVPCSWIQDGERLAW